MAFLTYSRNNLQIQTIPNIDVFVQLEQSGYSYRRFIKYRSPIIVDGHIYLYIFTDLTSRPLWQPQKDKLTNHFVSFYIILYVVLVSNSEIKTIFSALDPTRPRLLQCRLHLICRPGTVKCCRPSNIRSIGRLLMFRIGIKSLRFCCSCFQLLECMSDQIVLSLQVKVKAKDLRGKKKEELTKQLDELKTVSICITIGIFEEQKMRLYLNLTN